MRVLVRRPFWSYLVPGTYTSRIRSIANNSPLIMFLLASTAILTRQSYYRTNLSDEDVATYDRIDRRAYVALPDGRMALIYPIVDTQLTLTRTCLSFLDVINPLP